MFELVLMASIGMLAGFATGLIPGLHPNTLALLLLSFYSVFSGLDPMNFVVLIISMGVAHTFLSFIPSVYIGAPDEGGALSVLPGHRMFLDGRGYEAIYLTAFGGLCVIILSVALFPLISVFLPAAYDLTRSAMQWILLGIFLIMLLTEKGFGKVYALLVFLLSGFLGLLILETGLLFHLLTGLFGIPTLLFSLTSGTSPKEQTLEMEPLDRGSVFAVLKGFVSGLFVGVIPGIGASQAGVLVHSFTKSDIRSFLVSLGAINTVAAVFSIAALYLISRARSGLAIAIESVITSFGQAELFILISVVLFATGICFLVTLWMGKKLAFVLQKVDPKKLSITIIAFLVAMGFIFGGFYGILVMVVATFIGLLPPITKIKRTHSMGVLMLPIMLFYFPIL